jgi:hypothetical protein
MSSTAAWLMHFLELRDLEKPDGRPLFEYRVSQVEYERLRELLTGHDPRSTHECAVFCLYAAEWWRRHGRGLTFEGLLDSLEIDVHYTQLYEEIERGLKYWGRPLRIVRHPSRTWRDFVGSLSREGGLPLQLLLSSQGSVRRFFRQLLRAQRTGVELDADQVERIAGEELPKAWRDPDIFALAARLVRHVWDLRARVGKSAQPVVDLDRRCPDWQRELPLLVDNEVAAALVRGLVEDAQQIATSGRLGLDVQNRLRCQDGMWTFERVVELPPQIREREIWRILDMTKDAEEKPRRIHLFIDDGDEPRPLALATQWHADGPFDVTPLVEGDHATQSVNELVIQAETSAHTFPARLLRGGEALDESPWVFVADSEDENASEWLLVAQGSARVRSNKVLVAVAPKFQTSPTTVERCGTLETALGPRLLLQITSDCARFHDPNLDQHFEVEVGACENEANLYRLDGQPFGEDLRPPVWLGVPKVIEQPMLGIRREVLSRELEWRPKGSDRAWETLSDDCIGHVELRLRRGGATLFTKSVAILPPTCSYDIRPHREGAVLALSGIKASQASIEPRQGFEARPEPGIAEYAWVVTPSESPPARVAIALRWMFGRHMTLRLPFPKVGIRFIDRAGRVLPNKATVSLERLPGCRIEATLPRSEPHPLIECELDCASDRPRNFVRESRFVYKLRRVSTSGQTLRYVLDLSRIAEDIRLRLASSTELNACVHLAVRAGDHKTHITVRRFPISMRVDDGLTHVLVLPEKSETFVDELLTSMTVAWVPIESPAAEPMPLVRSPEGAWAIDDIDTGSRTRMIYGLDGTRCCARPVIWSPPGDSDPAPNSLDDIVTLEQAVSIPWKSVRLTAIGKVLDSLIADPSHPEWDRLSPYLASLGTLPATTYDVLDVLVQRPSLCVYALLTASPKPGFQTVWIALEDLIFAWPLVAVRDWLTGFRLWWAQIEIDLEHVPAGLRDTSVSATQSQARTYLSLIEARLHGFTVIRELIDQHLFGADPGQYTQMAAHPTGVGQQVLLADRDQAFMNLYRTHADERWPFFGAIRELAQEFPDRRPTILAPVEKLGHTVREKLLAVTYAPIQAAIAASCGVRLTPEQIFAIRQLARFDSTWFDTCYQTTLAAAIGILLRNDPEAFQ